jgi:HPt (histidine-containing phosphotransfer) domain-containing protein
LRGGAKRHSPSCGFALEVRKFRQCEEKVDDKIDDELLEMYIAEMPDRIEAFRVAFESNDRDGLKRLAHQLAGSAGSYGFPLLSQRARRLEMSLAEGRSLIECADELAMVIELCDQTRQCVSGN